ncbi:MAG: hypothetical protein ACRCZS_12710 [Chroococcidiopsis sp.]
MKYGTKIQTRNEEIATPVMSFPNDISHTNLSQQHQLQLINRVVETLDLVIRQ